jgi:hypothetical protein
MVPVKVDLLKKRFLCLFSAILAAVCENAIINFINISLGAFLDASWLITGFINSNFRDIWRFYFYLKHCESIGIISILREKIEQRYNIMYSTMHC